MPSFGNPTHAPFFKANTFSMSTILVANDDRITRQLLKNCLSTAGHNVVVASNGREALDVMNGQTVDLVLMDMNMPELDGWTAACKINVEFEKRVPVVAVTSYGLPADKARAATAGCKSFLSKPIDVRVLMLTVDDALKPQPN